MGCFLRDETQIRHQPGENTHLRRNGALLDQHGNQGRHNDSRHKLRQVGHHLEGASQKIGLNLIEEQRQNDGHREAEEQAVEAQKESITQGAPELHGHLVRCTTTAQKTLEIRKSGEELICHRLDLVMHLEAAQQLIHWQIAPEEEHQNHGYQHQIQTPVPDDRPHQISPVMLFHIIPDQLFRVGSVRAGGFVIDQEISSH